MSRSGPEILDKRKERLRHLLVYAAAELIALMISRNNVTEFGGTALGALLGLTPSLYDIPQISSS